MAIFNSYVSLPEGRSIPISWILGWCQIAQDPPTPMPVLEQSEARQDGEPDERILEAQMLRYVHV